MVAVLLTQRSPSFLNASYKSVKDFYENNLPKSLMVITEFCGKTIPYGIATFDKRWRLSKKNRWKKFWRNGFVFLAA